MTEFSERLWQIQQENMVRFLESVGALVIDPLRSLGELSLLVFRCIAVVFTRRISFKAVIATQFYIIGVQSLPVVLTTGAFAGAVFAYSFYNQLVSLGVESLTGALVMKMLTWHLGPVLTALVLAGRIGCAITAELGTMKVTEQVDALQTFGISPLEYLIMPRVMAALLMTPILTVFSIFIGISSALFMIVAVMGGNMLYQMNQIEMVMLSYDYVQAMTKAAVFGTIIAVISCRDGLATSGGAEGVGKATTSANVSSCVSILIVNMIVTVVLNYGEPVWNTIVKYIDSAIIALWSW